MKLPKITKEAVLYIDATPDKEYPIRILEAYLENANAMWIVDGIEDNTKLIYDVMNKDQEKRIVILEKAISILMGKI